MQAFKEHNIEKTGTVKELKKAYTHLSTFSYGSLSHCTLAIGLMNIKTGLFGRFPRITEAVDWRRSRLAQAARGILPR